MSLTIDAHQHFWQHSQPFDYSWQDAEELEPIRRDFMPEDLEPILKTVGIDRTIFVQTQHNLDETRWALGLADEHEFIGGVVGWVDLTSESCAQQLQEFLENPKFVGVRHLTQDEADDDFIVRDDVIRGLEVLQKHEVPFDLLFHVKHLKHAAALAAKLPDLPMVIDHLAKPRIKEGDTNGWAADLKAAAGHENVYCKLSGLITEADWHNWTVADLRPYVHAALDAFGPQRCMFGSDWPVCEVAGSYQQTYQALINTLTEISHDERMQIFGRTAADFYKLKLDSHTTA